MYRRDVCTQRVHKTQGKHLTEYIPEPKFKKSSSKMERHTTKILITEHSV